MSRLEACERLLDAVGGGADVDHGERVRIDNLEAAGPADVAQARSHGGFDPGRGLGWPRVSQPEQEQGDRDGGIVELERTPQAHFEPTKIVTLELKIEALPRRRDGFAAEPDLVADEQGYDLAVAIIFDDVRPQASAIVAIDDGAAGRTGVALVRGDQLQWVTRRFDTVGNGRC